MTSYNYDHIIEKLINYYAWVRVPHWIPLSKEEKEACGHNN